MPMLWNIETPRIHVNCTWNTKCHAGVIFESVTITYSCHAMFGLR